MSYKRPNPGRREREARKRHRRGGMASAATGWEMLKLGRKHFWRWMRRSTLDRDVNAARNILMLAVNPARTGPPERNVAGHGERALGSSPL